MEKTKLEIETEKVFMETVKLHGEITLLRKKKIKWHEITIIAGISAGLMTAGAAIFKLLLG